MLVKIPPSWASRRSFMGGAAVGQRPSPHDQYAALLSWLIKCSRALSDTHTHSSGSMWREQTHTVCFHNLLVDHLRPSEQAGRRKEEPVSLARSERRGNIRPPALETPALHFLRSRLRRGSLFSSFTVAQKQKRLHLQRRGDLGRSGGGLGGSEEIREGLGRSGGIWGGLRRSG